MDKDKNQYIADQVNSDYVMKSRQAAWGLALVTLTFTFLHKTDSSLKILIIAACLLSVAVAITRLINSSLFNQKKISLEKAVKWTSVIVLSNGALWLTIGVLSTLAYPGLNLEILTTFILLNAFSSGSVVTLSSKKPILMLFNACILLPQVFFSLWHQSHNGGINTLWLFVYAIINFVYTFKQSKVIHNEQVKRFAAQYELKKSLEEVEQSKKDLEAETIKTFHASRLSSLGEMASSVGHEINNPLTIIQGMIKAILAKNDTAPDTLDPSMRQKLEKVYSASERIAKIVKGMKLISNKSDRNEHEVISLSKLLEISLDLFEERFKHEQIIFTCDSPINPPIRCNPLQISQIIINLFNNALDELSNLEGEKKLTIAVIPNMERGGIKIRVINSGPLIEKDKADKLFEPFFTTKNPGKGTGLGLSISRTLAQNNDGNLYYEAYLGQVCFTLELPLAREN